MCANKNEIKSKGKSEDTDRSGLFVYVKDLLILTGTAIIWKLTLSLLKIRSRKY